MTYSQGVSGDGAAIFKDGVAMTVEEIVSELNEKESLIEELEEEIHFLKQVSWD